MCVLEEISVLASLSLKFSTYSRQEEEIRFLYLLVDYTQTSSAIKYLK